MGRSNVYTVPRPSCVGFELTFSAGCAVSVLRASARYASISVVGLPGSPAHSDFGISLWCLRTWYVSVSVLPNFSSSPLSRSALTVSAGEEPGLMNVAPALGALTARAAFSDAVTALRIAGSVS